MRRISLLLVACLPAILAACGGNADSSAIGEIAQAPRQLAEVTAVTSTQKFSRWRDAYTITRSSLGFTVTQVSDGSAVQVSGASRLEFTDITVNLLVADLAKTIPDADLKRIIELYIGFFNRVPDADGLSYWIGRYKTDLKLDQIAETFYNIAIASDFSRKFGYFVGMGSADFVKILYLNVLGRTADAEGLAFWTNQLDRGLLSRGQVLQKILDIAHSFKGDAKLGYVADLLDNKYAVGRYVAIQQGINYKFDPVAKSNDIARAVSATSITSAILTTDVTDSKFDLSAAVPDAGAISSALNDTGIDSSKCLSAGSEAFVDCKSAAAIALNSSQDGMIGRDVSVPESANGKLGFNFTKLDSTGKALPDSASTWSCVKDNVTGLMWEIKTSDGGLRDYRKTYTHFDDPNVNQGWLNSEYKSAKTPQTVIDATDNAAGFVKAVNEQGLCGYKDWRLPSVGELVNIADFGRSGPTAFDATWFGPTPYCNPGPGEICWAFAYWAATPVSVNLANTSYDAWYVDTVSGYAAFANIIVHRSNNNGRVLRLVRGPMSNAPGSWLSLSTDGSEVTDLKTGLVWKRCPVGLTWDNTQLTCVGLPMTFTHEQALAYARGQNGWRMPNVKELFSIVEPLYAYPSVNRQTFPKTHDGGGFSYAYWTSTPQSENGAVAIEFNTGGMANYGRQAWNLSLRLVKDAPK